MRNASGDMGFGVETSDREEREIAALEKNLEQLENDKYQPAGAKKKRNSGGSDRTLTPGSLLFHAQSIANPSRVSSILKIHVVLRKGGGFDTDEPDPGRDVDSYPKPGSNPGYSSYLQFGGGLKTAYDRGKSTRMLLNSSIDRGEENVV